MNYKIDHCNPFDNVKNNFWMKLEHCGRYLFAADFLIRKNVKNVLDLACAEGYGSNIIAGYGIKTIGADVNAKYIDIAKEKYKSRENLNFVCLDFNLREYPPEFDFVDAVVCFETLEHLKNPNVFLADISKFIKNGGYLIISFPNAAYEKTDEFGNNCDPYHLHIFDRKKIEEELVKNGMEILNVYGQSICNMIYTNEHYNVKQGILNQSEVDKLLKYNEKSIMTMSRLIGYPSKTEVELSYSFIYICRKK